MPSLADPQPWLAAQAAQASALADAARDLGWLEATLLAPSAAEAAGARELLIHIEVEAMLRAQGLMLGRDEIGRELMEARAASDPEALRLARWAVRRLEGQGALADLPVFLGLHRRAAFDEPSATSMDLRLQGREFDGAAAEFLTAVDAFTALHPLARGPAVLAPWRMAELSPPGQVAEPAVWSARHIAAGAEGLRFVPFGRDGRWVWSSYGLPADRLAIHLTAPRGGAQEARALILRIRAWSEQARAATAGIRGDNAARVIAVLAARPCVSAMETETRAGISRPTAERMLKRLNDLGLTRGMTGNRRFRLWTTEYDRIVPLRCTTSTAAWVQIPPRDGEIPEGQMTRKPDAKTPPDQKPTVLKSDSRQTNWRRANLSKNRAHLAVQRALMSGHLQKQPREVCGARVVDAHHDRYDEPLNVRWLCRTHHVKLHHYGEDMFPVGTHAQLFR